MRTPCTDRFCFGQNRFGEKTHQNSQAPTLFLFLYWLTAGLLFLWNFNSWMNKEEANRNSWKPTKLCFHLGLSSAAVLSSVIILAFLIYSKSYTFSHPTWTRASSETHFCVIDDIKDVKRAPFPPRIILITVSVSTGSGQSLIQIITYNMRLIFHYTERNSKRKGW